MRSSPSRWSTSKNRTDQRRACLAVVPPNRAHRGPGTPRAARPRRRRRSPRRRARPSVDRQRTRDGDDAGKPVGHVVAVAGPHDARRRRRDAPGRGAVELPLDRRLAGRRQGVGDIGGGRRQHRLHEAADGEADVLEAAACPSASATAATRGSSPPSIAARRTAASGTSAALATASVTMPATAPIRRSPSSTPRMKSCSGWVARDISSVSLDRRRSTDPGPDIAAISSIAQSRSETVSVASCAAATSGASVAQPTPILPCRSWPERKPTAAMVSSGSSRRNVAERC